MQYTRKSAHCTHFLKVFLSLPHTGRWEIRTGLLERLGIKWKSGGRIRQFAVFLFSHVGRDINGVRREGNCFAPAHLDVVAHYGGAWIMEGGREGGKEGGKERKRVRKSKRKMERGREGKRKKKRERERKIKREEGREGWREGGREREREGERERGKEGKRVYTCTCREEGRREGNKEVRRK